MPVRAEHDGLAGEASKALLLGLELFRNDQPDLASDSTSPAASAAAVRLLFEIASSDEARLEALRQAVSLAVAPRMKDHYPETEAHWIVAKAHNLACSAKGTRQSSMARAFMTAAVEMATGTGCKALDLDRCKRALAQWGMVGEA
jgi:cysteine sulfinate desulfinase/cysteine desulfurase-like protein